ncbi:MAG TPA: homoserine dehydrogenase, partial [Acidimicrobiales bacterium]|nr:homoserine dehydrogenase [Acidimicrobiales bacterium]
MANRRASAGNEDSAGAPGGKPVRVAVLGAGNVGGALVSVLLEDAEGIEARSGIRLSLAGVAVGDPSKPRPQVPQALVTGDAKALVEDPDVDVVVELIGGLEPAGSLVRAALASGKPVVTANKALLAAEGASLGDMAAQAGVDLLYEAAVAGAIPIIRPLRDSLAGEPVRRVMGIVNGTTNFILTRMSEGGLGYEEALAEAQQLGYAERDPTADVDGHDAAAKAAILASIAFQCDIGADDVPRQGISGVSPVDIAFADQLGYVVKLLAVAERIGEPPSTPSPTSSPGTPSTPTGNGPAPEISVRVHPTMLPATHPLAAVRGAFNAVFVEG